MSRTVVRMPFLVVWLVEGLEVHEDCFFKVFVPMEDGVEKKDELEEPKEEVVELVDGRGS